MVDPAGAVLTASPRLWLEQSTVFALAGVATARAPTTARTDTNPSRPVVRRRRVNGLFSWTGHLDGWTHSRPGSERVSGYPGPLLPGQGLPSRIVAPID